MIAQYSKYHSDMYPQCIWPRPLRYANRVRGCLHQGATSTTLPRPITPSAPGSALTLFRFDYGVLFDQYENNQVVKPYLVSAYIQDDWQVTPLTEARLGLRGTYYKEGEHLSLNPRFSLSRVLQEGWRVKLAGGSYRQYLQPRVVRGL